MATFRIIMKDPVYLFKCEANHEANCSPRERGVLDTFLEYDKYVTIEFDTEKCTARVIPVRELKD
jgi:hypothetical protein